MVENNTTTNAIRINGYTQLHRIPRKLLAYFRFNSLLVSSRAQTNIAEYSCFCSFFFSHATICAQHTQENGVKYIGQNIRSGKQALPRYPTSAARTAAFSGFRSLPFVYITNGRTYIRSLHAAPNTPMVTRYSNRSL